MTRKVELEEWVAVEQFRLDLELGKTTLFQKWMTVSGKEEWRPMPIMEINDKRKPAIAGYLEEDEDC